MNRVHNENCSTESSHMHRSPAAGLSREFIAKGQAWSGYQHSFNQTSRWFNPSLVNWFVFNWTSVDLSKTIY